MRMLETTITAFVVLILILSVIFLDFGSRTARIVIYDCDALTSYDTVPEEVVQECSSMNKIEMQKKAISI